MKQHPIKSVEWIKKVNHHRYPKMVEENKEIVEEKRSFEKAGEGTKKEQVVETTCGSHEKTFMIF